MQTKGTQESRPCTSCFETGSQPSPSLKAEPLKFNRHLIMPFLLPIYLGGLSRPIFLVHKSQFPLRSSIPLERILGPLLGPLDFLALFSGGLS